MLDKLDIDGVEMELKTTARPLPRSVETTAKNIETYFAETVQLLLSTAQKLEDRAASLRDKADWLNQNKVLAADIRSAVRYEREAFEEVQSLALVDVGMRQD